MMDEFFIHNSVFQIHKTLNFALTVFAMFFLVSLAACSNDGSSSAPMDDSGESSSSNKKASSSSDGALSSSAVRIDSSTITGCTIKTFNYFVADGEGFQRVRNFCADSSAGMTVFMTSTELSYVCVYNYRTKEAYWTLADIKGPKVTKAIPCKTENGDNCEYGSIHDERDGQIYKTVVIGDQTWMAENLNFKDSIKASKCRTDDDDSCSKYARFYLGLDIFQNIGGRQFCPDGWRLPSEEDAAILLGATGGTKSNALRSTTGWFVSSLPNLGGNGTDAYGFNAEPLGFLNDSGRVLDDQLGASFWLSTNRWEQVNGEEEISLWASASRIENDYYGYSYYYQSVRCVKDDSTDVMLLDVYNFDPGPLKTPGEFMNEKINYGTFEDIRDQKTYKTVVIGDQTWMAENLNFETDSSVCYRGVADSCLKYGRLYSWGDAMIATCPSGWRLPSKDDWDALLSKISTDSYSKGSTYYYKNAASVLMGPNTWNYATCGGTNAFGFTAMPSPASSETGESTETGYDAYFWSYTEDKRALLLKSTCSADVIMMVYPENALHPVRCIKDTSSVDSTLYSE